MTEIELLITKSSPDYELLDSGEGEKLERFGKFVISRPDPQALWNKSNKSLWLRADAEYKGKWQKKRKIESDWRVNIALNTFILKLSTFKHVGIFPEQESNWEWIADVIRKAQNVKPEDSKTLHTSRSTLHVLNLFGYTGGATLAALSAGAKVTHVDGSKTAIAWAKENVEASRLSDKPVRWILDDATTFVKREIRRGVKYDAIILDPPSFGYGPKGESWKIEKNLPEMMILLQQVISDNPIFILINGYASGYSSLSYKYILSYFKETFGGVLSCGEMGIEESLNARVLPAGIFARWQNEL